MVNDVTRQPPGLQMLAPIVDGGANIPAANRVPWTKFFLDTASPSLMLHLAGIHSTVNENGWQDGYFAE